MNRHVFRIIILWIALATVVTSCREPKESQKAQEPPIPVTIGLPTQTSGGAIRVSGQVESKESAVISTRMMGFVSSIQVKVGDQVRKGQLLLRIHNDDLLAKRAQAQAMVNEAEAAFVDAKKDYDRYESLYKNQSASTKEWENIQLQFNSVNSKVEAARQMKKEVDAMLTYTELVAPFDGLVAQKNIDEGSLASPGVPLLLVEQRGNYVVRAAVSEAEVSHLTKGMRATIRVKSSGVVLQSEVLEISPSSVGGSGQYQVKVSVPALSSALLAGMNVSVHIPIDGVKESHVLVPARALVHRDQLVGVYTVSDEGTAFLRWVKIGNQSGADVEVLAGLLATEKIVLKSEQRLYSGATVIAQN